MIITSLDKLNTYLLDKLSKMERHLHPHFEPFEQWRQFCIFVQNSKSDINIDDTTDPHKEASLSLFFLVGGQDTVDLLYRNGLCMDEILKFREILSKLEELCLFNVIKLYKQFSESLDYNVVLSNTENIESREEERDVTHDIDILPSESSKSPSSSFKSSKLTEAKNDVFDKNSVFGKNRVGIYNEKSDQKDIKILERNIPKENVPQNSSKTFHVKNIKSPKKNEKTINDVNQLCQRRSSRAIRISSRYAENKDVIKNLLKPDLVIDKRFSYEPPCICSACQKKFPDSKALVSHWSSSHQQEYNSKKKNLPFCCAFCKKCFAFYSHLKVHFKQHSDNERSINDKKGLGFHEINSDNECKKGEEGSIIKNSVEKYVEGDIDDQQISQIGIAHDGPQWEEKKYECKLCNKTFKHERSLELHRSIHTGERPYLCNVCGKSFRLKICFKKHARVHDVASHVKCDLCSKTCLDEAALEKHKLIHSGMKSFFCEVCGKEFSRLQGYTNHMRFHKSDSSFKCDICDKKFVDKWGLIRHKTVHTGEKPFVCSKCGKMFRLKRGMVDHMKVHDVETRFKCHMCPRSFVDEKKLQQHVKVHSGDKHFICDKCGKQFLYATNLKVHKRVHTGEKPYPCRFCDKRFNQLGTRTAHERHHTGDRPFVCEECGAGFLTTSHLTVHRRKHFNDRPYKCDQCDYATFTSSLLKIHKIKHSGLRPYSCSECSATFKRLQHLEAHKRTHLNTKKHVIKSSATKPKVKKYNCAYCEESFDSDSSLTAHLSTHEIVIVSTKKAVGDIFDNNDQGPEEVAYNIVVL